MKTKAVVVQKNYTFSHFQQLYIQKAKNTVLSYHEGRLIKLLSFGSDYHVPSAENGLVQPVCDMVTAEQRIIGMCAEAMGTYGKVLWETKPEHELVTHFWSAKGQIKYDNETREYFLELSEKILRQLRIT